MGRRELRAGLVFVLASVAAGGAFRGWQRAHPERFDAIVASLVEADARERPAPASAGSAAVSAGLTVNPGAMADSSHRAKRSARPASAVALRPASMDVDRASAAELERLPGIGPALAGRIVAARTAGGAFGGPDGLLRVPGIGPKTLEKIRPYLKP